MACGEGNDGPGAGAGSGGGSCASTGAAAHSSHKRATRTDTTVSRLPSMTDWDKCSSFLVVKLKFPRSSAETG